MSKMIFTMGLPASGKSTTLRKVYGDIEIIDPDAYKENHPEYDANNPAALHEWSQIETEKRFAKVVAEPVEIIAVDGTGVNAEKMVRRIIQAQAAGYKTELVYVKVPLRVAIERNAKRARTVPEHIICQKALDITTSFEIVSSYVDQVTVIDNS